MKTYIVKKVIHSYDEYYEENIFITNDDEYAKKYVSKFNRTLSKAKKHAEYMKSRGICLMRKRLSWHFYVFDIAECSYDEIETRFNKHISDTTKNENICDDFIKRMNNGFIKKDSFINGACWAFRNYNKISKSTID